MANTQQQLLSNLPVVPTHCHHHHPQCAQSLQQIQDPQFYGIHDRNSVGSYHSLYNQQILNEAFRSQQRRKRCMSESDKATTSVLIQTPQEVNNDDCYEGASSKVPKEKLYKTVAHRFYTLRHYIALVILLAIVGTTVFVGFFRPHSNSPDLGESLPNPAPLTGRPFPVDPITSTIKPKVFTTKPRAFSIKTKKFTIDTNTTTTMRTTTMMTTTHHSIVNSAADLLEIDKNCQAVTVKLLKDEFKAQPVITRENVKNLNIVGPVTEDWIQHLLKKFSRIENLTIDAYELCRAAKEKNKNSLTTLTLGNIKSLEVQNSKLCPISCWIFKWNMPNIRNLSIHNSDLDTQVFEPIHAFFERNKDTLSTVLISHSYLCDECNYTDIKFTNLKEFKISEQRTEPWYSDDK